MTMKRLLQGICARGKRTTVNGMSSLEKKYADFVKHSRKLQARFKAFAFDGILV